MSEEIKTVKPCVTCGAMDRRKSRHCRPCSNAYGAKWRVENPEKNNAYCAKYRAENPEKIKAKEAKYRIENREKFKAYQVKYCADNPEKVKAYKDKYRAGLKESAAAKTFFQMLAGAAAIAEYVKEQNNKKTA